jgi:tetratricopeptide (TPR) repeat protein
MTVVGPGAESPGAEGQVVGLNVEDLAADLAARRLGDDPDGWALAAYRLALASSELATRPDELTRAVDLLARAGRILTAERAPLEHGRILTATASCHRAAGRPDRALPLFEKAARLADGRAPEGERAAGLVNVGLARAEAGRPVEAIEPLDEAVRSLERLSAGDDAIDDEVVRLLGAALVNRAQAHQAIGDDQGLGLAIGDYRSALDVLPPESLQAGMAAHGLGAALLEANRRDPARWSVGEAIGAFERSLGVFGPVGHPLQHAVARHSLALAHERRDGPGDLARALDGLEAALSLFDPRLHRTQWRTAADALERVEAALDGVDGPQGRSGHLARFLADTSPEEREAVLGERLGRLAAQPRVGREAALTGLAAAMAGLPADEHGRVLRSLISGLMTVPDAVLEVACAALVAANAGSDDRKARNRVLDEAIHDTLFGPQRVRVRDLLEAAGWVRP